MRKNIALVLTFFLIYLLSGCLKNDHYQVYALKYLDASHGSANNIAIGGDPDDSVMNCFMIWLLKGNDGRNILVDAGYIDTSATLNEKYIRPDLLLQRMNIDPAGIGDLILTHPHWDHIGGITLFQNATIWMQKADFEYYVSGKWQEDGNSRGFSPEYIRDILNVRSEGRLKLVEGDSIELMPGIRAFTGSKHSFENMYLLINENSVNDQIVLASDASWFYYNLDHLLSVPLVIDPEAYVRALKRMKTMVSDPDLIIPGHDDLVFSKFPQVADRIVKIEK
ncbi:MAG TPA: MBL fold metallo-hydrolase [Bacteroidales bacterium]|nr:MBL fold metallo-hydrolase [Bacteroidales bacterium]